MGSFSSKIGVLLAAAGSAVGLGSIWKFPYVVGENGGGAFIILYVVCSLIFGLPLVIKFAMKMIGTMTTINLISRLLIELILRSKLLLS